MKTERMTKEQAQASIRARNREQGERGIWMSLGNWRQINELNGGGYFSCPANAMGFPTEFAKHRQGIR